jgi:ABC-2 type transport system permease protein
VDIITRWLELLTLLPLAALTGSTLGLVMGTFVEPRRVPVLFGVVVIPITFLGATYYPWAELTPIPWLKTLVLLNPLVYMSEAMRISLTPQLPHMAPWAVYLGLAGLTLGLSYVGIRGFRSRVLT